VIPAKPLSEGRADAPPRELSLAVVVPAHRAEGELGRCLDALLVAGAAPGEILVVDDGSDDGTGAAARARGVRVLRNDRAEGPAEARNRGARAAEADLLLFVDADVAVDAAARRRVLAAFAGDPELDAVFGSYDDAPPAPALVSRYRNLLHHFVHQHGREDAATFWTGLGAVRREAFLGLGGLDRAWQDVEDVEFGVRLRRAGGRIRLDRDLQGTHLKAWTLRSMLRTDLIGRAIPWSRLALFEGAPSDDLNLSGAHRASAACVALLAAALPAAAVLPQGWRLAPLAVAALALLGFVLANRRFLGFLRRRRGLAFAAAALPFHALHYAAAILGFAWVLAREAPRRRAGRRPPREPVTGGGAAGDAPPRDG
jgi:GT2 family glycosyltransferase